MTFFFPLRFHIYVLAYCICFSLSDLLHSVWQTLTPSTSVQIPPFRFFLWLSNIPLCCKYAWHLASNRRGLLCSRSAGTLQVTQPSLHLQKELLPPQPWELVAQPSDSISTSSEGAASPSAVQSCSSLLISSTRLSLSESKMHVLLDPETPLLESHPTTRLAHMQNGVMYKVLHYNSVWKPPQ